MECSELRATLNYRQVSVPRCPDKGGLTVCTFSLQCVCARPTTRPGTDCFNLIIPQILENLVNCACACSQYQTAPPPHLEEAGKCNVMKSTPCGLLN